MTTDETFVGNTVISPEQWYDLVTFPMAQLEASLLCGDLARSIRKSGSGRQRGEGIKLLKRIRNRYTEDFNRRAQR